MESTLDQIIEGLKANLYEINKGKSLIGYEKYEKVSPRIFLEYLEQLQATRQQP